MNRSALPSNKTDDVDEREFLDAVASSFFTWVFANVLPTLFIVLYSMLLAVGVGTNILLMGVAIKSKLHKHCAHTFLLQFSVLDILACVLVVLPTLVSVARGRRSDSQTLWHGGDDDGALCKLHVFMFVWCLLLVFALYQTAIAERATLAVAGQKIHLQTFGNSCFVRLLAVGVWAITFLVALLLTLTNRDDVHYRNDQYQCALDFPENPGEMHVMFSLTVYGSLIVFSVLLCVMFRARWMDLQTNPPITGRGSRPETDNNSLEQKSKSLYAHQLAENNNKAASEFTKDTIDLTPLRTCAKANQQDIKSGVGQYTVSLHTEKTEALTTSVFNIERVNPDHSLRPIMHSLHRSNARVDAAPLTDKCIKDNSIAHQSKAKVESVDSDEHSSNTKKSSNSNQASKSRYTQRKAQKVALPEFRSKQLWIKAKGSVTVRNKPVSVFRDVPHDVNHHQSMTYLVSWAVTCGLWLVYVAAAFSEVYGSQTCHTCYRVGVLMGLCSYSIRPLILVAHNRWYRQQCFREIRQIGLCLKKICCCKSP
ncbi:D(2) dopamine receptor [Plakobranchus ocellatus]|uniref:D(2) dopamine receptor n=1 Tax=Plakobranchus ocellatus TaxID=259542 RepID=A0AAV3ZV54_9GAST|nr:D(2) dopamine receptor [Plakobranchus ocellatus]